MASEQVVLVVQEAKIMKDFLLVIDMQEDYLGSKRNIKRFPYQVAGLVRAVNQKRAEYPADHVIYVTNRFFWEMNKQEKQVLADVNQVSDFLFEKRRASCFSRADLLEYLRKQEAETLTFVGVDGNACVNRSVLSALALGFQVTVNLSCLGLANIKAFQKTLARWKDQGAKIEGELL